MIGALTSLRRAAQRPLPPGTLRLQFALIMVALTFPPNALFMAIFFPLRDVEDYLFVWAYLLVVVVLLALVAYFVIARALVRPLARLTDELQQGQPHASHDDDPTEVRGLRDAFQGLLLRLRQERDRRNAFMATLVHDLKTPLIATNHLVEVLRDVPLTDAQRAEIHAQILHENGRLLQLVQQMADAHRFERERAWLDLRPTDLRVVADRVRNRFVPAATARDLSLTVDGTGIAHADASQLERALSNLVDNACRYADRQILVRIDGSVITVRDDGPGLSDTLERLAQPFNAQPVEIAGRRYTAGTAGLGLYIARRIAEEHGGTLSYRRDHGLSTFEIVLNASARRSTTQEDV